MKLIERVYYSLVGKKVKTLLLLLVITLLGSFLSASFSIYQANKQLENTVLESLNPIILIDWNYNQESGISSDMKTTLFDNKEEVDKIINRLKSDIRVSYIENRYELYTNCFGFSFWFSLIGDDGVQVLLNDSWKSITLFNNGEKFDYIDYKNGLYLKGTDQYSISDIRNGAMNLAQGRIFTEDEIQNGENVFFHQEVYNPWLPYLDEVNEYKHLYFTIDKVFVDDFLINNRNTTTSIDVNYQEEFKMIGYGEVSEPLAYPKYNPSSFIFGEVVPYQTLKKLSEDLRKIYYEVAEDYPFLKDEIIYEHYGKPYVTDTYIELASANELNLFVKDLKKECGDLVEGIYSYTDSYNDVKVVTNNLNIIAIISLVVCSIASIILLSLIIQVFVHERRHEIGIYLSMGESRKKVITQILLEVLLVGMIGISLSIFSGHMISKGLSSDLLERQIIQQEEIQDDFNDDSFEINKEEILDTYSVEITAEYVICVFVGGFIVLILSSIYPMNSILKMKPKKMLM